MVAGLRYHNTAERPEAVLGLPDGIDVSSGYTFVLKIGTPGSTAVVTKSSGLTGGVGQVTVTWTAGELAPLPPSQYVVQLTATTGGLDRVYETMLRIDGVVT